MHCCCVIRPRSTTSPSETGSSWSSAFVVGVSTLLSSLHSAGLHSTHKTPVNWLLPALGWLDTTWVSTTVLDWEMQRFIDRSLYWAEGEAPASEARDVPFEHGLGNPRGASAADHPRGMARSLTAAGQTAADDPHMPAAGAGCKHMQQVQAACSVGQGGTCSAAGWNLSHPCKLPLFCTWGPFGPMQLKPKPEAGVRRQSCVHRPGNTKGNPPGRWPSCPGGMRSLCAQLWQCVPCWARGRDKHACAIGWPNQLLLMPAAEGRPVPWQD